MIWKYYRACLVTLLLIFFSACELPLAGPELDAATRSYLKQFLPFNNVLEAELVRPESETNLTRPVIEIRFSQPMVSLLELGRDARTVPVAITPKLMGRGVWETPQTLIIYPDANVHPTTRYEVRVSAGIESLAGIALTKDAIFSFMTPAPPVVAVTPAAEYRVTDVICRAPCLGRATLEIHATTSPDVKSLAQALTIAPAVQGPYWTEASWNAAEGTLVVPVAVDPDRDYVLMLSQDASDSFGKKISAAQNFKFRSWSLPKTLQLDEGLRNLVRPEEISGLGFVHASVSAVHGAFKTDPSDADVIRYVWNRTPVVHGRGYWTLEHDWNFPVINQPEHFTLPFDALLKGRTMGIVFGELTSSDWNMAGGKAVAHPFLAQVTRLGLYARWDTDGGVAWVTNRDTLSDVSQAEVRVCDDAAHVLAQGMTDAAGLFRFPLKLRAGHYVVFAHKGGDKTFLPLSWAPSADSVLDVAMAPSTHIARAALILDGDRFTPGNEIHVAGFLRSTIGDVDAVTAAPLDVMLVDASGEKHLKRAVEADINGMFQTGFALPKNIAPGRYDVRLYSFGQPVMQNLVAVTIQDPSWDAKHVLYSSSTNGNPGDDKHYEVTLRTIAATEVLLQADKAEYVRGATASLSADNLLPGERALVILTDGSRKTYATTNVNAAHTIEVPLTKVSAPVVDVSVVLLASSDATASRVSKVRAGHVRFKILPTKDDPGLLLSVFPDGVDLKLNLAATHLKSATKWSVSVFVGKDTPNCGVATCDLQDLLSGPFLFSGMQADNRLPTATILSESDAPREVFKGAQGQALDSGWDFFPALTVSNKAPVMQALNIPEDAIAGKITAFTVTDEGRAITAVTDFAGKSSLSTKWKTPDFVRQGDEFEAQLSFMNTSGKEVLLTGTWSARALQLMKRPDAELKILSHDLAQVCARFLADTNLDSTHQRITTNGSFLANAALVFSGTGGATDLTVSHPMTVLTGGESVSHLAVGSTDTEQTVTLTKDVTRQSLYGGMDLQLGFDAMSLTDFVLQHTTVAGDGLAARVARVYPFVVFSGESRVFTKSDSDAETRSESILAVIADLQRAENLDGGFSDPADHTLSADELTELVGDFLLRAKAAGFTTATPVLNRLAAFWDDEAHAMAPTTEAEVSHRLRVLSGLARARGLDAIDTKTFEELADVADSSSLAVAIQAVAELKPEDPRLHTWLQRVLDRHDTPMGIQEIADGYLARLSTSNTNDATEVLFNRILHAAFASPGPLTPADYVFLNRVLNAEVTKTPITRQAVLGKVILNGQDIILSSLDPAKPTDGIFLPFDKLPAHMDVTFHKDNGDRLYYALSFMTEENRLSDEMKQHGVFLSRHLFDLKGNPVVDGEIKRNTIYEVRFTLQADMAVSALTLSDPIAAGLSWIKTEEAQENGAMPGLANVTDSSDVMPNLDTVQLESGELAFAFHDLPRGISHFSYFVRTQHVGRFAWPPADATSIDGSGLFGTSEAGILQIR